MAGKVNAQMGLDLQQVDAALKKTENLIQGLQKSLKQLDAQFKTAGASGVLPPAPINASTEALGKHGKEVSKVTQLYRQERAEQRLQNFLFREGRDVVMLLAFSMATLSSSSGDASESTKKLSGSLMVAFTAFTSLDFAVKALSMTLGFSTGGLVTAITAVVAVGAGLYSFFKDSGEEAENLAKQAIEARKQLAALAREAPQHKEKLGAGTIAGEEAKLARLKEELLEARRQYEKYSGTLAIASSEGIKAYNAYHDALAAVKEQREVLRTLQDKAISGGKKGADKENYWDEYLEEQARIVDMAEEEKKIRLEGFDQATEDAERINALLSEEEKRSLDVARSQDEYMNGLVGGLYVIQDGLAMISGGTDSFLSKMIQMIQYALQISKLLSLTGEAKNAAGGGLGVGLGVLGSVFGMFGLFDRGGFTGSGGKYEPAGLVHRGEYVMSKRAVDMAGVATMESIHRRFAGYASGGLVTASASPLSPNVIVVLKNPITWGDGLKKNMPIYSRWNKNKTI